MFAHKIVDALLKRNNRYRLMGLPGLTPEILSASANRILRAEKFDFGPLLLERNTDELGSWALPGTTKEEFSFWKDGLIPLPAPTCWFECTIGESPSGLCVWTTPEGEWCVERADLLADKSINFDGIISKVHPQGSVFISPRVHEFDMKIAGNLAAYKLLSKHENWTNYNMLASVPLSMYLNLMLNSRTTEVSSVQAVSPKLAARQIKRGHTPLPAHRIVRIVPNRYIKDAEDRETERMRHPDCTGDGRICDTSTIRPEIRSTYRRWNTTDRPWLVVPRCLVGRAELGAVSHEYKFIQPKGP